MNSESVISVNILMAEKQIPETSNTWQTGFTSALASRYVLSNCPVLWYCILLRGNVLYKVLFGLVLCPVQTESHCFNGPGLLLLQEYYIVGEQNCSQSEKR